MLPRASTTIGALGVAAALALALGVPADAQDPAIDFGDDASVWARDGECDDPRFAGRGMTLAPLRESERGHDAADCRAAFEMGRVRLRADAEPAADAAEIEAEDEEETGDAPEASITFTASAIDFGDDASVWAEDGECDDPRFAGEGVAARPRRENAGHDATDCRAAVTAGRAAYRGELPQLADGDGFQGEHDGIDFGDNTGTYAFDGECDDPRFAGDNVAPGASRVNVGADADDCRRAYDQGRAQYEGELPPLFEGDADGIDFGDNSGPYPDDDECDDPRFSGRAVAVGAQRETVRRDSHDCHEAYLAGSARYEGELEALFTGVYEGVDFGDNEGPYADDGECDDRRFRGYGMARPPWNADSEAHDAADCQALFAKGFIRYVAAEELFMGEFEGVDFGDNSGSFVNDGECDDSRFEGPGAGASDGANDHRDAFDCKLNFEAGSIIPRPD